MMKRLSVVILVAAVVVACSQKAEQKPADQASSGQTATPQTAQTTQPPPRPATRQSDARVWIDSVAAAKGSSGRFGIHYYGVEPVRAMVMPLTFPAGMVIDSVSYAGSMVEYIATRPVRIDNEKRILLITAIPTTEPDIPAKEGLFATAFFKLGPNAVSGIIDETFVPPGNYLTYVDTTTNLAEPQFEPGKITVK